MSLFLIEETYAERLRSADEAPAQTVLAEDDTQIRWLHGFLRGGETGGFVIVQTDDPKALVRCARKIGLPSEAIIEIHKKQSRQN